MSTSDTETRVGRIVDRARSTIRAESAFPAWEGSFLLDTPPDTGRSFRPVSESGRTVEYEIEQTDSGYVLLVDVPGFDREEISIEFVDGWLSIHGETTDVGGLAETERQLSERFGLPATVSVEEVTARHHRGVLEIELPTDDESLSERAIEIAD